MTKLYFLALPLVLVAFAAHAQESSTLEAVKGKDFIQCGISGQVPGFSSLGEDGEYQGIDVDFCRAMAAAVFGDPSKVKYSPLTAKERFTALQSGEVDILSRNTTWTSTRDTALGLNFAGVNYYDGQGFMVRKDLGITSVKELDGASVCTQTGTTTELNLADYFRANDLEYQLVAFERAPEVIAAYEAGRCDAYTTDQSGLAGQRLTLQNPDDHKVLPEVISKEPLGPVVRQGDDQWFDITKWVLMAQLEADELGVTSENVDQMKSDSGSPAVKRLLGVEGTTGEALGLTNDWAYDVIKLVGNYGEVFAKNLGPETPIGLERGVNALWNQGGLMYPMPIR
ncbi:MAG: amino acid ABC transporter substrate-binding protein [Candidatus Competibacterales bacterium]